MQRRELLKAMVAAGLMPASGLLSKPASANVVRYDGPIYFTFFAEGGWDVTSLCDPKDGQIVNQESGETVYINHWAENGNSIQTISNGIQYAPFANNADLFTNHGSKMMVVNGIDAQTNAHSAGVRHVFSGRFADGYPAITALAAAKHGAGLPLAFLSNGGYRETAGLTNFTLMQDPNTLGNLINPNSHSTWGASQFHRQDQMDLIKAARTERVTRLQARNQIASRLQNSAAFLESSAAGRDQLVSLNDYMPETLEPQVDSEGNWHPILRQVQLALVSAAAGLTVSADIVQWGFDTHDTHDENQTQAMNQLIDGVNTLWRLASEMDTQYGTDLTGRLRVVIASDFGRTPWYNDGNGKDHWPIGSAIFMQNSGFFDSVVGATTSTHDALGLNGNLEAQSENSGTIIEPRHFHGLLRQWADVYDDYQTSFPLDISDLDLRALI